jgi:hypothetical protein
MAYGTGASRYLAFIKEVTAGTTPTTPVLKKLRNTGGNGITNERSVLQSGEIRSDRGISDVRLGQNQPAVSVPFEFSYESFREFLEGAMGSRWKGNVTLSVTVDFMTSPASTIDHSAGSSWLDLGLNIGDYIVVSDTDESANAGIYKISNISSGSGTNDRLTVTAADGSTAKTFTADTDDAVTIRSGYKGGSVNTTSVGITVAATGKTYTAASALWITTLLIKVGDVIYFSGFTNAGNNGWKKVTAVTDLVLTVSQTCTNETKSTGNVEMGSGVGYLVTGTTAGIQSFTIEEGFVGITQYHSIKGAKVDKFSISCQPDKMIDGSFDLVGMTYTGLSASSIASSVSAAGTNSPFDSFTGSLSINSGATTEADAIVSGVNIQISNALSRKFAIMSQNAAAVGEGRVNVSGSVNAFFTTSAPLAVLYAAETEITMSIRLIDLDGNAYVFDIPRLKFTKDSRSISENDVTESLDFQALIDTNNVTMAITGQPVI